MSNQKEVEIRFYPINHTTLIKQLESKGAKLFGKKHLIDYWFCDKNVETVDEASFDHSGYALRIRCTKDLASGQESHSMECKTPCSGDDHSLCNEYEIDLSDTDQARKILEAIGMKEFLVVEKERIQYRYHDADFCLDTIKHCGEGLEIEKMTNINIQQAKKDLIDLAKTLDVDMSKMMDKGLTYIPMKKLAKF